MYVVVSMIYCKLFYLKIVGLSIESCIWMIIMNILGDIDVYFVSSVKGIMEP